MREPRELTEARRCLAQAEADFGSDEGLARLAEGLEHLDGVIAAGAAAAARTATNLAQRYASRILTRVHALVAADPQLPEPVLEHLFKVVLAFDGIGIVLPDAAAELKIDVVRRLIDRYYEGHPPERKQQALAELAQLARRD